MFVEKQGRSRRQIEAVAAKIQGAMKPAPSARLGRARPAGRQGQDRQLGGSRHPGAVRRPPAAPRRAKQACQQVAAGRGPPPVQHLAGHEHRARGLQFQPVQRLERPGRRPTRSPAPGPGVRSRHDRRGLDRRRQGVGRDRRGHAVRLAQQADLDRRQVGGLAQPARQRLSARGLDRARGQLRRLRNDRAAGRSPASPNPPHWIASRRSRRQGVGRPALQPA